MKRFYSLAIVLFLCSGAIATAEPLLQPAKTIPKAGSVFVIHPFENPLTVGEVEQMRTRVIANFRKRFQKSDHPIVFGSIDVPEGAFIAAYGFTIYADGMTAEYLGLAGDPQSVPIIHENARKWHKETETHKGSDAQILCFECPEWTRIASGQIEYYECPYGGVRNNYKLYICSNDNSSNYDWYGIGQWYQIFPGCNNNEWVNEEGRAIHKWSATTLQNPVLVDYDPDTELETEENSITADVCVYAEESGCCTECWGFWLGSYTRIEPWVDSLPTIAWRMFFTADNARKNTRIMQPGSICRVDQPCTPGEYKLLHLKSVGIFTDGTETEKVAHEWIIYVDY